MPGSRRISTVLPRPGQPSAGQSSRWALARVRIGALRSAPVLLSEPAGLTQMTRAAGAAVAGGCARTSEAITARAVRHTDPKVLTRMAFPPEDFPDFPRKDAAHGIASCRSLEN